MLETPIAPRVYKRDVLSVTDFIKFDQDVNDFEVADLSTPVIRRTRGTRPTIKPGRSPTNVEFASNYNEKQHYNLVVPIYSDIVYTIEVSGNPRTIRFNILNNTIRKFRYAYFAKIFFKTRSVSSDNLFLAINTALYRLIVNNLDIYII